MKGSDIKFVAVSHTHADHIGNVELFPQSTLLVQKAEYDWAGPNNTPRFAPEHPVTKLEGDHDVFGDGNVRISPRRDTRPAISRCLSNYQRQER